MDERLRTEHSRTWDEGLKTSHSSLDQLLYKGRTTGTRRLKLTFFGVGRRSRFITSCKRGSLLLRCEEFHSDSSNGCSPASRLAVTEVSCA